MKGGEEMGEIDEWKPLLKRIGVLIRKVISMYVEQAEREIEKGKVVHRTYTCKHCGLTFANRYSYSAHQRIHK
jgi:transposase-like protein